MSARAELELALMDILNGDYVVTDRIRQGFLTYEEIDTFNGFQITKRTPTYACYATPEQGEEAIGEDHEGE